MSEQSKLYLLWDPRKEQVSPETEISGKLPPFSFKAKGSFHANAPCKRIPINDEVAPS